MPDYIKIIETSVHIGNTKLHMTSDLIDGEILDTKVEIGDQTLCWIAGCTINDFVDKFRNLIDEYRI